MKRNKLLIALGDCQDLFGQISAAASDRNPNRAADIEKLTAKGFKLCVDVRSEYPPIVGTLLK